MKIVRDKELKNLRREVNKLKQDLICANAEILAIRAAQRSHVCSLPKSKTITLRHTYPQYDGHW